MGVMSTLSISRTTALTALAHLEFGQMSDAEIQSRLDDAVADGLYNVSISLEPNDNDAAILGNKIGLDLGDIA